MKDSTAVIRDDLDQLVLLLTQASTVKTATITIDNSAGTSDLVQALFTATTSSKRAVLKHASSDTGDVYIGNSTSQDYPLAPGEKEEIYVSDLSQVYVRVPAGATATLYVLWEV